MAGGVVGVALLLLYAIGLIFLKGPYRKAKGRQSYAVDWIGPFRAALRWKPLRSVLEPLLHRPRMSLAVLSGGICPPERLLGWAAETAAMAYGGATAAWILAAVSGDIVIGWIGMFASLMLPALRTRDLRQKAESRKQAILHELPVMLNRLLVLVNAGENIRRALARTLERDQQQSNPLYEELRAALAAMERGESMSLAMEEFGRRCGVPEVQMFSAVLLMNVRRGGETLVTALRDLTRQMWEKRKAHARTLGEQASSRMAFPLIVLLLIMLTLIAAPAVMMI